MKTALHKNSSDGDNGKGGDRKKTAGKKKPTDLIKEHRGGQSSE